MCGRKLSKNCIVKPESIHLAVMSFKTGQLQKVKRNYWIYRTLHEQIYILKPFISQTLIWVWTYYYINILQGLLFAAHNINYMAVTLRTLPHGTVHQNKLKGLIPNQTRGLIKLV